MKKKRLILGFIIIILTLYLLVSLWLIVSYTNLVKALNASYGMITPETEMYFTEIGDSYEKTRLASSIGYYYHHFRTGQEYHEKYDIVKDEFCIYFVAHSFFKARIYYEYSYIAEPKERTEETPHGHGSYKIPCYVDLKLKGIKWVIVDYHEAP